MLLSRIRFIRAAIALSPQAKVAVMIGGDAVFLPLCMLAAVALRQGSLEDALATAPLAQVALALLALPVLALTGLYRTVVRYIDLQYTLRRERHGCHTNLP